MDLKKPLYWYIPIITILAYTSIGNVPMGGVLKKENVMRTRKLLTAMTVFALMLAGGCGSSSSGKSDPASAGGKLVVYTPNSKEIVAEIVPAFEKKTGVKVEVLEAGAGEILTRVKAEANSPSADVLLGAVRDQFDKYFEKYVSPNDKYLQKASRNVTGLATAYISNGSVLLVNDKLEGSHKIQSYEDLLRPELRGKIAAGDPSTSSSAFAQLTNQLKAMGGNYTSRKGWDYVGSLIKNLDGKVASSSSAVARGVADGEYTVGVTYEEPAANYVKDGASVHIVYPREGAVFLDSYVGIVKKAPHRKLAEKFVDFVISKDVQDRFGTKLTNRPLRSDASLGKALAPMSSIKSIKEDGAYVEAHRDDIVRQYTDLFASLQ